MEGRSRKHGGCALLGCYFDWGLNSESGFVLCTGKLTVLSRFWDHVVKPKTLVSEAKASNAGGMDDKRWIHCGCCIKILTVWKIETRAGSKLCLTFNTYIWILEFLFCNAR